MVKFSLKTTNTIRKTRIVFALLIALSFSSRPVFSQTAAVSINLQNASLADVFREIEKQTDYKFFYNNSAVASLPAVEVSAGTMSVSELLDRVLAGNNLGYRMVDNYIVIVAEDGREDEQVRQLINSRRNTVTGQVMDENGHPMIGVSVIEQGTTNGISTDLQGNYNITVQGPGAVLLFSYIGYDAIEETVGSRSRIDVGMSQSSMKIDEVVVTAMGIKREAKTLTYNVQEVNASEVSTVRNANLINSLAGKVAGVTINASSSGMGGSSRVVMRGTKSLSGNNNALYVVDGIAMPDLRSNQPDNFQRSPDVSDTDAISFINPDDIESISVLTGAAASALYGSQGANGVVIVTTKKGVTEGVRVNLSNSTSFVSPFVLPEFQNTYGREDGSFASWGGKMLTPSSYNPKDFFQTGRNIANSVSVAFGNEKNNTYVSAGTTNTKSPVPNTEYNRYNFMFRNVSKILNDKVTVDLSASYMLQDDQNMRAQGQYHNPLVPIYLFPPSDDINKYKIYERYSAVRNFKVQYWPYGNLGIGMQNPYWVINRSMFSNDRKRYMLSGQVRYEITDWINVTGRIRVDNMETLSEKKFYASSDAIYAAEYGHYMNHNSRVNQLTADVIVNIDKHLSRDFRLTANVGASLSDTKYKFTGFEGDLKEVVNFFHLSNINLDDTPKTKPTQNSYHDQIQAMFATAQIDYKNRLFLEFTGRIDWPTFLGGANTPYVFYPGIGLSGIISDMVNLRPAKISFLKARVSYSKVGNSPGRYNVRNTTYPIINGNLIMDKYAKNPDLKAELTNAFETGINLKMFDGKLSLDATYYLSNTFNQLFTYIPPLSDKFAEMPLNGGHVRNQGVELGLGYRQNYRNGIAFSTNVTFSLNRNKIINMTADGQKILGIGILEMNDISVSSALNNAYEMRLFSGQRVGDIYVKGLKTDEHGNIWVSNTGDVAIDDNLIKAGNANPDFNMGWRGSISYKGFDLGFLFDARVGGIVVSATQSYLDGYGVSKASAEARDRGYAIATGGLKVDPQKYYQVVGEGRLLAPYVYSATNVRLRELSLSYALPSKWFKDKVGVQVSVTGSNLWMIYNKAPFDPEVTASTGTYYQGFDYFMMPSMRSWGFGAKIQF